MMAINKKTSNTEYHGEFKKKIWKIFTEIKDKDRML